MGPKCAFGTSEAGTALLGTPLGELLSCGISLRIQKDGEVKWPFPCGALSPSLVHTQPHSPFSPGMVPSDNLTEGRLTMHSLVSSRKFNDFFSTFRKLCNHQGSV